MLSTRVKKFIIIDLDGCALSPLIVINGVQVPNPREDLLSSDLIDKAKLGGYDGLYACTHRGFQQLYEVTFDANRINAYSEALQRDFDTNNLLTTRIVENFSQATGLPLQAVSTPDDGSQLALKLDPREQCGYGFANVLKPFESTLLDKNKKIKMDPIRYHFFSQKMKFKEDQFVNEYQWSSNTKNSQLLQIAQHVFHNNADCHIILDYFDDQIHLCNAKLIDKARLEELEERLYSDDLPTHLYEVMGAMQIPEVDLPHNISMNVFNHNPIHGIVCNPIGTLNGKRHNFNNQSVTTTAMLMNALNTITSKIQSYLHIGSVDAIETRQEDSPPLEMPAPAMLAEAQIEETKTASTVNRHMGP